MGGLVSELQEFENRMSESDLNTYKLQLQQVEAALTTDPDNEELNQLKTDLEEVLNLTLDLINAQLGQGTSASEDDAEAANKKEEPAKKKSRWAEPDPILPVKPWQVGENCMAIYPADHMYYDAKIEEITTDGEVSVKFKGYKGSYVTTLGLLRLPSSGTTTVHATGSAKNKKELANYQRELKKEKKKEKNKWTSFSAKAFGKKGFVKKSIFKTPETAEGKVGVGTCGISGQKMTDFNTAAKYRKGQ